MKHLTSKIMIGAVLAAAAASLSIAPVLAQNAASSPKTPASTRASGKAVTQAQRLGALGARGDKEVSVRVDSLNKLVARIQGLRNVSDAQKASIVSTLQGLITNLTNLQTQIGQEASSTALKDEVAAITQNYRVYALAIPQLNIFAAADRITTIVAMMNTVGGKLQARLAAATGVPNMTALQTDLSDLSAKISDANTKAQAAVAEVSPLTPDQGDKTKLSSNLASMKDARSKIIAAQKDLIAARKDARIIIEALVKSDKSIMTTSGAPSTSSATTAGTTTP